MRWLMQLPRLNSFTDLQSVRREDWDASGPGRYLLRHSPCLAITWGTGFRSMPSNLTAAEECKACVIKLRRIGDAQSEVVDTQSRTQMPSIGEVIEVPLGGATARARVVQMEREGADGTVTIEADELSSSYVWDTFTALAQFDADAAQPKKRSFAPSNRPPLAFEATLTLVRECHALAWRFLDRPKPDLASALRYMRVARRAAWLAFPYIQSDELRRRIVGYKPMSQSEWEQLWPTAISNV
jgi:hypothetical protein